MLTLPQSELYVWLNWSSEGENISKEIINTIGFQPSEKSIYQGIGDLRWEVNDFDSAVKLAENIRKYIDNPEVILVRATGIVAGEREILTLKDSRRTN